MQYTICYILSTFQYRMAKNTLYLIDGSGFIFRAYYAIKRDLTSPSGVPVKAVYGFVTMIQKLMEQVNAGDHDANEAGEESTAHIAVIFDAARQTFRNEIYAEYKANRDDPPEDLIPQFPLVREATAALNLPAIDKPDFEADDIIATYAKQAKEAGMDVVIVSSDKDLMQLIQPGVTMYDAMKDKTIGDDAVLKKFDVGPDKVLDVLSLMGDSSDNVPGVPGIGPKTAAELINTYGDLETLLERAGEIKQNKRRETIIENADMARLSKQLITLRYDVPDLPPLAELAVREPNPEMLLEFLQAQGFKSLVSKVETRTGVKAPAPEEQEVPEAEKLLENAPETNYTIVREEYTLEAWVKKARAKGYVAFDTETTSLNAMQAELVGFSLCAEAGQACYVPIAHTTEVSAEDSQGNLFDKNNNAEKHRQPAGGQIPLERAIEIIKPLLEDKAVLKIGHNIKYDWLIMRHHGVDTAPVDDTMLLSYALHAGEHGQGMDELANRYLGLTLTSFDEVTGKGKNRLRFDEVEIEKAAHYAAEDADITLRLHQHFKTQLLQHGLTSLYETTERPLIPVICSMEHAGILVDPQKLLGLSAVFAKRMAELKTQIYKEAGHEFNVGSPKQLGEVLFEEMQLEGGKKSSKTGAYSTDSSVLEDLAAGGVAIAEHVLEWRGLAKLKSTYSDALAQQINPHTKRVHTSYALAVTSTGRLSSSDPNLQNIPIRTAEGRKIREAFVAKKSCVLLAADYSQIELRLLAHMAKIDVLKDAFKNGDDIHAITASQMFGVPLAEVDSELRRKAKTINFGIIYGISAHGLAVRLGISRKDAAAYIEQYFTQYPGIRNYMEATKEFARKHGYVKTLYGRRCHVPGINDKNGARRQFSERAAINAPLQGTAADIIKRAMIDVKKALTSHAQYCTLLLQVHDELVFEVAEDKVETIELVIKKAMEKAASLSVPLVVECGTGSHWGEAH